MQVKHRQYQIAICILFLLKIVMFVTLINGDADLFFYGDANEYFIRASTLIQHRTLGLTRADGNIYPDAYRLPGYSVFLASTLFTSGPTQLWIWSLIQLVLLHAWLMIAGQWIYGLFGGRSALYFVLTLSVTLPWVHYPLTIHSDFQFALLVFSSIMLLISANERKVSELRLALAASACMSIAALTRPDLVFMPLWFFGLAGIGLFVRRQTGKAFIIWPVTLTGVATLITMAIWSFRNYLVVGDYTFTTVVGTVNKFFSSHSSKLIQKPSTDLVDTIDLIFQSSGQVLSNFVPALIQIFFNPGRWYLHRYVEAWKFDDMVQKIPFKELNFFDLSIAEQGYILIAIVLPVVLISISTIGFFHLLRCRVQISGWSIAIILWTTSYFVIQKGIWGAVVDASGPRYAMSIWPFVIFLGAMLFAQPERTNPKHH